MNEWKSLVLLLYLNKAFKGEKIIKSKDISRIIVGNLFYKSMVSKLNCVAT